MAKAIAEEVATLATVVALALRGGVSVTKALDLAIDGAQGSAADEIRRALVSIELGLPADRVFEQSAAESKFVELQELFTKLQLTSRLGSGLAGQLDNFVLSLRNQIAVNRLAKATARETRMLLPLVFLVLPVTVLFAIYPSLQILNTQMEGIQ